MLKVMPHEFAPKHRRFVESSLRLESIGVLPVDVHRQLDDVVVDGNFHSDECVLVLEAGQVLLSDGFQLATIQCRQNRERHHIRILGDRQDDHQDIRNPYLHDLGR